MVVLVCGYIMYTLNRCHPSLSAPTAATMDPVSIQEFPDHVRLLHADDDYRFSEEYKVLLRLSLSSLCGPSTPPSTTECGT